MAQISPGKRPLPWKRRLVQWIRALVGTEQLDARIAALDRRLERIEGELDVVNKIWMRTRNLEAASQAILRAQHLDPATLDYPEKLTAQRFRLSSQNQEDGIVLALLREAGISTRRFVEIGSGLSGGNSAFLAREWGWSGLMVDGHADHMTQVGRRFPTSRAVGAWVTRDNINELIAQHGFSGEVDLFSLDLDGNDYWIWQSMTACTPRVVVLEYNSAFGAERAVTIPYDPTFDRRRQHTMYYGASLAAMTRASAAKGYRLVAVEPTGVNAFFLREDLAPHVPACDARRAFRLLEKYDVLMQQGEDVYAYVEREKQPLVEIS